MRSPCAACQPGAKCAHHRQLAAAAQARRRARRIAEGVPLAVVYGHAGKPRASGWARYNGTRPAERPWGVAS